MANQPLGYPKVNATMKIKLGYIIASNLVAKERRPIGYLYREVPDNDLDSGWRVFAGTETQAYADEPENLAMYNASTILEIDPSIEPLLRSAAPVAFERDASGRFVEVPVDDELN